MLPALPTVAEQGFPGYDANPWWGLAAPAGTPDAIIAKLHAESVRIVRAPDVTRQWQDQGLEIIAGTPAEFAKHLAVEVGRWAKIVRESGAQVE